MKDENVILYDGYCPTCNFSVKLASQFTDRYYYSPIQSEFSQEFIKKKKLENVDSIILKKGDDYMIKSNAVLEIAKHCKSPIKYFYFLRYIPKSLRDYIYDVIAKNRFKLTGKYKTCQIPKGLLGRII